eukprot:gene9333-12576_t
MLNEDNIQYLIVIHRKLGCNDEAASDNEQAEKILYYYPEHISIDNQLTKINMLEGLIEFSSKFSFDPLDSVVMERVTWGFYEAEKDLWIIIGVGNKPWESNSDNQDGWQENADIGSLHGFFYKHRVNINALNVTLKQLYHSYFVLNGFITEFLQGKLLPLIDITAQSEPFGDGWSNIVNVQSIRKKIRKLQSQVLLETKDLNTLENNGNENIDEIDYSQGQTDDVRSNKIINEEQINISLETMNIKQNMRSLDDVKTTLAHLNKEILELETQLNKSLNEDYTPKQVRSSLGRFMRFQFESNEIGSPSLFNDFNGIHWNNVKDNSYFSPLLRIRQAVEKATHRCCIGLTFIHSGQVLWSDMDSNSCFDLFELVRLQEAASIRAKINQFLVEISSETSLQAKFHDLTNKITPEEFIQKHIYDENVYSSKGFIIDDWQTLNLDEAIFNPADVKTFVDSQLEETKPLPFDDSSKNVIADHCFGPSKIFCPKIHQKEGQYLSKIPHKSRASSRHSERRHRSAILHLNYWSGTTASLNISFTAYDAGTATRRQHRTPCTYDGVTE